MGEDLQSLGQHLFVMNLVGNLGQKAGNLSGNCCLGSIGLVEWLCASKQVKTTPFHARLVRRASSPCGD